MSARAAGRLESLGFEQVYRYAGSKADWRAAGLPMDGTLRRPPRALDAMHRDTPTCSLDASVSDARHAAEVSHEDYCTVLGLRRLVLGRIRGDALHTQGELPVREVMEDGPTTVRADEDLTTLIARMKQRGVDMIIVTDPEGQLLGVLDRREGERVLTVRSVIAP